jgi:ribosomal protein S18 acetylase RimI-like enzyme
VRASQPAPTIRLAQASDAAFVRRLSAVAFAEYDPGAAGTTAHLMHAPGARTLLAERSGVPLGFVIVQRQRDDSLALAAIAVTRREQGLGVGRRLMQAAEREAKSQGIGRLTLTTAQANLAALDLFLRSGFVITKRNVVRYWRGQPACHLEKQLA